MAVIGTCSKTKDGVLHTTFWRPGESKKDNSGTVAEKTCSLPEQEYISNTG